jgi:integrase
MTYPAATLTFLAAKKKWYVSVTIPPELRDAFGGKVQIKRSTGTADKRDAQRELHEKAASIYESFDKAQQDKPHPLAEALQATFNRIRLNLPQGWEDRRAIGSAKDEEALDELAEATIAQLEALTLTDFEPEYDDHVGKIVEASRKAGPANLTPYGALTFASVANDFVSTTNFTRQATKKQTETVVKEFAGFIGDVALHEIVPVTLYSYAQELSNAEYARNTIRGRIDKISLVFHHAVRKGLVSSNPCLGLKLKDYGKPPENYVPLADEEVKRLFALHMPTEHNLLLKILAMTGARLDEIALLTWDEIEKVTLSDGSEADFINLTKRPFLIKTRGSLRRIPIHPSIQLSKRGQPQERLFPSFTTNTDGKTTSASEVLMGYIRKVTTDPLKVVHSLRGGFKDKLRDVGVSKETNDFITGHASGDVAGKYGAGPSLSVRFEAVSRLPVLWS